MGTDTSLTNPAWEYLRDHQEVLVGVAAYGNPRFNLNSGGETRNAQGLFVSGRFFDTLGVTRAPRPPVHHGRRPARRRPGRRRSPS